MRCPYCKKEYSYQDRKYKFTVCPQCGEPLPKIQKPGAICVAGLAFAISMLVAAYMFRERIARASPMLALWALFMFFGSALIALIFCFLIYRFQKKRFKLKYDVV